MLALAAGHQQLVRVLLDWLEQAVPGLPVPLLHQHEGLVDQARDQVEHVGGPDSAVVAHGFDRLQRATLREHRQAAEDGALEVVEEPVAPVQCGPQGLLPRRRRAAATHEQTDAVVEPRVDLFDR